jgi:hypothetical protein
MRKTLNIILGGLIALLCGCKSQENMIRTDVMVMYGPPSFFQPKELPEEDAKQPLEESKDMEKAESSNREKIVNRR